MKTIPIQIACARNNSAALEFLLDKKANIDVKVVRRAGYAPPHYPYYQRGGPALYLGGLDPYLGLEDIDDEHPLDHGYEYLDDDRAYRDRYGEPYGDKLLHICVRNEALDCLLILLPFCEHLLDVKNDSGETPRQVASHIWEAVVEDFDANWCNPAVELVSQHLINDVAGMVVAYGKLAL